MTLSANRFNPPLAPAVPYENPSIQTSRLSLSAPQTNPPQQTAGLDGDDQLLEQYARHLRTNSDAPWLLGGDLIGPIPPDSTLGKWRLHLETLLQSPDVKAWARSNRIDLSKAIGLFAARGNTPGFASFTVKPLAGTGSQLGTVKYFGSFVGDRSHTLPLSWPLIMQAAAVLANGQAVIFAPRGDMARVKDVAAFYGESLPATKDATLERATQLEKQKVFAGRAHLNKDEVFETQKSQRGDLSNLNAFNNQITHSLLDAFVPLYLGAQQRTQLQPGAAGYLDPDQFKAKVKDDLETLLGRLTLPIDPHSSYYREQALAPGDSVSLKRFIEDSGWLMPTTLAELRNLYSSSAAPSPCRHPMEIWGAPCPGQFLQTIRNNWAVTSRLRCCRGPNTVCSGN